MKDHPFVDGNKRIAAAMFLWFLERNGILYPRPGEKDVLVNTTTQLLCDGGDD